jgi:hypothetical protein
MFLDGIVPLHEAAGHRCGNLGTPAAAARLLHHVL